MDVALEGTQQMLYRLVHNFIGQHGGDFEEALSIANEAFVDAWLNWNSRKAKFTTYLWWRVRGALMTHLRNRTKQWVRETPIEMIEEEVGIEENRSTFFLDDFISVLSWDARQIVGLVFSTPRDFRMLNRDNAQRRIIYKMQRDHDWSVDRIENAMATVRWHLLHFGEEK